LRTPRIYFYCCEDNEIFQDDIIPLAEGLEELGIPYFARANYWRRSTGEDDYLFRHTPHVRPEDCDVVVVPSTWFRWWRVGDPAVARRPFPDCIKKRGRNYLTVYVDFLDGNETVSWEPDFRHFDLILRAKLNSRIWHPSNLRASALGLSRRIINAGAAGLPFSQRRKAIFVSYNASHPFAHGSRTLAIKKLHPLLSEVLPVYQPPFADIKAPPADPLEQLMWIQTNGRHSSIYYERLKTTAACSAFCGDIIPPMPYSNPQMYIVGGKKAKLRRLFFDFLSLLDPRPNRIISCDSFRFWETLAAGSVAFNVDLEKYGVALPVMPENWKHYIGVDFSKIGLVIERLREEPNILEQIARQGREWALQHYAPKPTALRFLATLGFIG
jgi:hypothetical protein